MWQVLHVINRETVPESSVLAHLAVLVHSLSHNVHILSVALALTGYCSKPQLYNFHKNTTLGLSSLICVNLLMIYGESIFLMSSGI